MATIATKVKSVEAGELEKELTAVDAGVVKIIPAATSLAINGGALTQAQIDAKLKSYLATFEAVDKAFQQYQTALAARRNIQLEARDFFLHLKGAILAYLGSQNPTLAEFGFNPAKPRVAKTSVENAVIGAKAQLTRKARGTTSKKQKAAIKPLSASPAVAIAGNGQVQVTAPTVINAALPGSSSGSGSNK